MCGICGKWVMEPNRSITTEEITKMNDSITHRGPDDSGIHINQGVAIAHRRLSIIDLEASKQPMCNEDGTVWIVYNGEVYNFQGLREYLLGKGHEFKTSGDTEVILHLYEEFGEECVKKLRGMFAFAIWDDNKKSLFLARDRLGIKPLHYYSDNKQFIFGSEIKSIINSKEFNKEIDLASLHYFLSFLYVPAPQTMFSGIKKLLPGHCMTVDRNNKTKITCYWQLEFSEENEDKGEAYYTERLRDILTESIKMRLIADVPLGAFLSGGIDSSAVVGLMAGISSKPVKTFSVGFEEKEYNEASDAKIVADHFSTDHTEVILNHNEMLGLIPELVAQFDEPFGDTSAFPTYLVCKHTSENVKVALSGDGGDELFGGYYWRHKRPNYQLQLNRLPGTVKNFISTFSGMLPDGIKGVNYLKNCHLPYHRYILNNVAIFDEFERAELYSPELGKKLTGIDAFQYNYEILEGLDGKDWMNKMQKYDILTYLPNDILVKVDIMSMFNSLEVRVPILDHKVAEFAATIPPKYRIKDGISKYVLKQCVADKLPSSILEKKKQGFRMPLAEWLNNELKDHIFDVLLDKTASDRGYFSRKYVEDLLNNYQVDMIHSHKVWELFITELWLRKHFN